MTEDRLIEIISAYGADEAEWPADERAAAKAALARSEIAMGLLAQEDALDRLIAPPRDGMALGALKARILLAARGEKLKPAARLAYFPGLWRPACVLLAAAMLGVGLGAAAQIPPTAPVVIAADDPPQQLVLTVAGDPGTPEEVE